MSISVTVSDYVYISILYLYIYMIYDAYGNDVVYAFVRIDITLGILAT